MLCVHSGYTIPKGSKIMMCALASHLNTEVYEDPSVFNPWRWKVRIYIHSKSNQQINPDPQITRVCIVHRIFLNQSAPLRTLWPSGVVCAYALVPTFPRCRWLCSSITWSQITGKKNSPWIV